MIDARDWDRPSPDALRAMIPEGVTQDELAARLGKSPRTIRYWLQRSETDDRNRIDFCGWYTLSNLVAELEKEENAGSSPR